MSAYPTVWHAVSGQSMWPLAAPAQVALDDAPDAAQVGDIVGVIGNLPQTIILHRVEIIDGDRVFLRGDTRDRGDPAVPRSAIVGRLCAVRWGPLTAPVPRSGPIGALLRVAGRGWAQVAPTLRTALRSARQARANVDTH